MSFAQRKAFYEGVDGWVEIWETWQVATGWRDYRGSGGHPSAIEEETQGVTSLLLKRNRIDNPPRMRADSPFSVIGRTPRRDTCGCSSETWVRYHLLDHGSCSVGLKPASFKRDHNIEGRS
jgi:hypothetical protein